MNKVILFGGTFDPPHVGHLTMAVLAMEQTGCDELWFIPALVPPHKLDRLPEADFALRCEMVEKLITPYPQMRVCRIEATLPIPSYTADTVAHLQKAYKDTEFVFLLGGDSFAQLLSWHEPEELAKRVPFAVAARNGYEYEIALDNLREQLPGVRAECLEMPLLDISSQWIRQRLADDLPICDLVPRRVLDLYLSAGGK